MQKEERRLTNLEETLHARKYLFWVVLAILVILSYYIIKPYLIATISAFIIAYLVLPLHRKLSIKLGENISATLLLFLVILVLIAPLALVFGGITQQAVKFSNPIEISDSLDQLRGIPIINNLMTYLEPYFEKIAQTITTVLVSLIKSAAEYTFTLILSITITLFGLYVILVDWNKLSSSLERYLPVKNKKEFSKELSDVTNRIVYGTLLIAIMQFFLALIGFYLSGVSSYLLLPSIIFFLGFIPGLGPALVWVPLALFYFLSSRFPEAIGVTITGLILSIWLDTIFRTTLVGSTARINPFILLIGVLGGITVFGVFGFIIGPLILVYTIKILEELSEN